MHSSMIMMLDRPEPFFSPHTGKGRRRQTEQQATIAVAITTAEQQQQLKIIFHNYIIWRSSKYINTRT